MDLNTAQEVHLSHYWNVIYKRWKIALAILIVVMAGTFVASYFSTPLYKSSVSIQIERENPNQLTVEDLFGIQASDQEFMQTQYYLLKSRGLADRTIKEHNLLSDADFYPSGITGKTPAEIDQIRGGMAGAMLGSIGVDPVHGTNLVDVSYIAASPKLAQKVTEGLADSYMRMNVEKKLDATRQASDFLARQIATVRGDIDDAQQLAVYRTDAPDMIALRAQVEKMKQSRKTAINDVYEKAKASARSAMAAASARESSMHNAFDDQKRETLKLNANAFTYADLRSVIESKRTLLDQLTKRLDETEVTSRLRGSNSSNIHVVEHAQL